VISFEYEFIRRIALVIACLALLVVSDISAQDGQDSVDPESSSANVDVAADKANSTDGSDPSETADGVVIEEKAKTGKSEVEYNEDNYRRFMELKDQDRRSSTLPTNTFQPGTQKLDELPEESQKHLRNELRSVIVQEGEWQAGDENNEYAYVPSEAAVSNSELQKLEAEAWVELVDKYQEREAQIHANSARSEAARQAGAAGGGMPPAEGQQQGNNGSAGQAGQNQQDGGSQGGQSGQSGQTGQSGQQGAQNQQQSQSESASAASKNSYSPADAAKQMEKTRNQGVSENALQFLTKGQQDQSGSQSGNQGGNSPNPSAGAQPGGQARQQTGSEAGQEAQRQSGNESGQQSNQQSEEQPAQQSAQSASDSQANTQKAESDVAAETTSEKASSASRQVDQDTTAPLPTLEREESGTTQNAFEQLRGQAQQGDVRQEGSEQEGSEQEDIQQKDAGRGSLLIRDLINAQGVVVEDPVPQADVSQDSPEAGNEKVDPDTY
jgi:hypothetical protein